MTDVPHLIVFGRVFSAQRGTRMEQVAMDAILAAARASGPYGCRCMQMKSSP